MVGIVGNFYKTRKGRIKITLINLKLHDNL